MRERWHHWVDGLWYPFSASEDASIQAATGAAFCDFPGGISVGPLLGLPDESRQRVQVGLPRGTELIRIDRSNAPQVCITAVKCIDGDAANQALRLQLWSAAGRGDASYLRDVLRGANVNFWAGPTDWTPLYAACKFNHPECVQILLRANANVNLLSSREQSTPLIGAAHEGHSECVNLLLKAGANQLIRCDSSHVFGRFYRPTAFILAAENGHYEVCLRLLLTPRARLLYELPIVLLTSGLHLVGARTLALAWGPLVAALWLVWSYFFAETHAAAV